MTTTPPACSIGGFTLYPRGGLGGHDVYCAKCACGYPIRGWDLDDANANFDRHLAIPAPPADVLARTITLADVRAWPEYFISGPGRAIASQTDCGHGYYLTDSCPCCD
ncbi:hypothetical protein [Nocardia asiatica]|uniref:hypothetical protein n=1 Tax=Nocardia asiatica TaxID=209252 RepID=UPI0002D38F43|nr:hypothetical protein [Nocardia asiatica]